LEKHGSNANERKETLKMSITKQHILVLTSGGVDSCILLGDALRKGLVVWPVYIQKGLRWEKAEIYWLKRFLRVLKSPHLKPLTILKQELKDLYPNHWMYRGKGVPNYASADQQVEIPGRNLLMLAKAALFCRQKNIHEIWLGTLKGNPFPDATQKFFQLYEKLIAQGLRYKIKIKAPFINKTKKVILGSGKGLPLHLTFSCLNPHGIQPCRQCNKCAEKDKTRKILHP